MPSIRMHTGCKARPSGEVRRGPERSLGPSAACGRSPGPARLTPYNRPARGTGVSVTRWSPKPQRELHPRFRASVPAVPALASRRAQSASRRARYDESSSDGLDPFSRTHSKDHGGTTSPSRHPQIRRKAPKTRGLSALACYGRYWARNTTQACSKVTWGV